MNARSTPNHSSPATMASGTIPSRQAFICQMLFLVVCSFTLVVLNGLVDNAAIDVTLIPRLLALLIFLVASVIVVSLPPVGRLLDFSVLGEPLVPLFAGYLLVTCGSLLVAANISAGFTDVFRTLATFLTFCLFCLILPIVPRWHEQLLRVTVLAGIMAVAVGCYEILTRLGFGIHGRRSMEQITGLMSSVNLYAGILVLVLPWCLCGAVLLRRAWRGLAAATAAAIFVIVVLLQSRAAWLAVLAGGAAAVGILLAWPDRFNLSRRTRKSMAAACLAGIVTLAGGIATAPADNFFAQRFRSIFIKPSDPAALPPEGGRLMIWGITSRMIADHPFTGVGAGNFTVRLHEYFGDDDIDFSDVHTNWLQPHNDFLWVFAEKGVLGIGLFVGLFVVAFAGIAAILRSDASTADRWLALTTGMGLVSYLVLSTFDFPLERINHQVYLALLFAVVNLLRHGLRTTAEAVWPRGGTRLGPLVALPVIIIPLGLGIAYSLAALQQEKDVIAARRACRLKQWEEMLAASERARTPWKTLDPMVSPVAFLEGIAHVQLGHIERGISCLEQARIDNPNRMYVLNNLGILYARTGRFDEAIECFGIAANRYPHRIEPFNNLASCLLETGRPAEAVELLEQIPDELRNDGIRRNLETARAQAAAQAAEPVEKADGAATTPSLPE